MMDLKESRTPFQEIIKALLDINSPFPPRFLHRFSDLSDSEINTLESIWDQVMPDRRAALFDDLETINDSDFLVNFELISHMALKDPDERVKVRALSILYESEDYHLIPELVKLMLNDREETVRAQAATTLGKFIYLGELEEIPAEKAKFAYDALLLTHARKEESTLVKQRALEALSFSSNKEIHPLILEAYEKTSPDWKASALLAMGRSADEAWNNIVMEEISNSNLSIQSEAITAAGELGIKEAREPILALFEEEMEDSEVRDAAIWALAKIGGDGVRELLEELASEAEETGEDDDLNYITSALDELDFTEEIGLTTLLDLDEEDTELDNFIDLENDDQEDQEIQ